MLILVVRAGMEQVFSWSDVILVSTGQLLFAAKWKLLLCEMVGVYFVCFEVWWGRYEILKAMYFYLSKSGCLEVVLLLGIAKTDRSRGCTIIGSLWGIVELRGCERLLTSTADGGFSVAHTGGGSAGCESGTWGGRGVSNRAAFLVTLPTFFCRCKGQKGQNWKLHSKEELTVATLNFTFILTAMNFMVVFGCCSKTGGEESEYIRGLSLFYTRDLLSPPRPMTIPTFYRERGGNARA